MNYLKQLIAYSVFFILANNLFASHFIGGEMTYECKGDGVFDFTMTIYKECAGGVFCFDSDLECENELIFLGDMTVYRGTEIFGLFRIDAPETDTLSPFINNTCVALPPNICVEKGVYKFSRTFPPSDLPYTMVYQRCCRNRTILNIPEPSSVGFTYATEITPLTFQSCNSSPVFKEFPPIVICTNEEINFDHSATDIDGDRLVYSFCAPLAGGGPNLGIPSAQNGIAPQPEAPPPYNTVTFNPGFSGENPLNGDPVITIDPETGLITGRPRVQGLYVVGVCVGAYQGGQIINTIRRDFQFNVADCEQLLKVDLPMAAIIFDNGNQFLGIKNCGIADNTIINNSTPIDLIETVEWVFATPTDTLRSNEWDASDLTFPEVGVYEGVLRLNPDTECNLDTKIQFELLPDITANFSSDFDTCAVGDIQFTDLSVSEEGANTIQVRAWDFGNNEFSTDINPLYFYEESGAYQVTLKVTGNNGCQDSVVQEIPYFPLPPLSVEPPDSMKGCQPFPIVFDNLRAPINNLYDITWNFSDGSTSNGFNPLVIFENTGIFSVDLSIKTPLGCTSTHDWANLITVLPSPTAQFSFTPTAPTSLDNEIEFTNETIDADRAFWLFNNRRINEENPIYEIDDARLLSTYLIVTNEDGCRDSLTTIIDIEPKIRFALPNAFSPNSDGINDIYLGKGNLEEANAFELTIWNRYGEQIFRATNPTIGWNGKKNNIGQSLPEGMYTAKLMVQDIRGATITQTSMIALIR